MRLIVAEAVVAGCIEEGWFEAGDLKVIPDYSGRGMFGKKVAAIEFPLRGNAERLIPFMMGMLTQNDELDHLMITFEDLPNKVDSMGGGLVMYNPHWHHQFEEEPDNYAEPE